MPSLANIGVLRSILAKRFKLIVGYIRIYNFARPTWGDQPIPIPGERYEKFPGIEETT
jgi:hypothetical protein